MPWGHAMTASLELRHLQRDAVISRDSPVRMRISESARSTNTNSQNASRGLHCSLLQLWQVSYLLDLCLNQAEAPESNWNYHNQSHMQEPWSHFQNAWSFATSTHFQTCSHTPHIIFVLAVGGPTRPRPSWNIFWSRGVKKWHLAKKITLAKSENLKKASVLASASIGTLSQNGYGIQWSAKSEYLSRSVAGYTKTKTKTTLCNCAKASQDKFKK